MTLDTMDFGPAAVEVTPDDIALAVEEAAQRAGVPEAAVWSVVGRDRPVPEQVRVLAEIADELTGKWSTAALEAPGHGRAVVVPSPSADYAELAGGGQHARFRKHLLTLGPLIHPATGQRLELGEEFASQLLRNFDAGVGGRPAVPLADSGNRHNELPERNAGEVVGLERRGDRIYSVIEVRKPEVAEGIRNGTIMGASAFLNMDYTDTRTGKKAGPTLLHHCITNRPYVLDLEPYEEIAATAGSGNVVMLTAAPAGPPAPLTSTSGWRPCMLAPEITDEELTGRLEQFVALTGYAGVAESPSEAEQEINRYLALAGSPQTAGRFASPAPVVDVRNACGEIAASKGYDHSPAGLSRALDDLVESYATELPAGADELRMSMGTGADVELASDGYALDWGGKPRLPCDSPAAVRRSWQYLHQHLCKKLSEADFAEARDNLIEAADRFGFTLQDGLTPAPGPDGTPAVTASQMSLSQAGAEVERILALAGQPLAPARPRVPWPAMGADGMAELIAERHEREEPFRPTRGRRRLLEMRIEQQEDEDHRDHAQPALGGQVHPEVARLMRDHNDILGRPFGAESPRSSSGPLGGKARRPPRRLG